MGIALKDDGSARGVSCDFVTVHARNLLEERRMFDTFIGNVPLTFGDLKTVFEQGSWSVVIMAYFLMYNCLTSVNKIRRRPVDHTSIHRVVLEAINDCASGSFETLFSALYR